MQTLGNQTLDAVTGRVLAVGGNPLSDIRSVLLALITKVDELANAGPSSETVTSGALALGVHKSELSVTGTVAFTLAAPTYAGQRKRIECRVAASTPAGTLTITSPDDTSGSICATTFLFDTVGQAITLEATSALKWRCIVVQRAGVKTLTVGTTTTASMNLYAVYALSVTGTVASTVAAGRGIPNGSAVGETCFVGCSTAASTPSGTIEGVFSRAAGNSDTTLGTWNATTQQAVLTWNGSRWQISGAVGGIVTS